MSMKVRMRACLGLLAGLTMLAAPLSAGSAQAAAAAPSDIKDCFLTFYLQSYANGNDGYVRSNSFLYFDSAYHANDFCESYNALGSGLVTIFVADNSGNFNGDCLAYNATTQTFQVHNPNGCGESGDTYLVWKFIDKGPNNAPKYQVQNQYAPAGMPCISLNSDNAAVAAPCNPVTAKSEFYVPYPYQKSG